MLPHPERLTGLTQDLHAHLILLLLFGSIPCFVLFCFVFSLALAWLEHFLGVSFSFFLSFWEDYCVFDLEASSYFADQFQHHGEDWMTVCLLTICWEIILTYLSYFESLICSLTDELDLFIYNYRCLLFFLFDYKLMVSFVHLLTDRLQGLLAGWFTEINLLVCSVNTGWLLLFILFF